MGQLTEGEYAVLYDIKRTLSPGQIRKLSAILEDENAYCCGCSWVTEITDALTWTPDETGATPVPSENPEPFMPYCAHGQMQCPLCWKEAHKPPDTVDTDDPDMCDSPDCGLSHEGCRSTRMHCCCLPADGVCARRNGEPGPCRPVP